MSQANQLASNLEFDSARILYEKACRLSASIDDRDSLMICRLNLAALAIRLGATQEGEDNLKETTSIALDEGSYEIAGSAMLYLSFYYMQKEDWKESLRWVLKAQEYIKLKEEKYRAHSYLGVIYIGMDKPDEGFVELKKSFSSDVPSQKSFAFIHAARSRAMVGQWEQALELAEEAIEIDRDQAVASQLAYDYAIASEISAGLGNKDQAILYRKRSAIIRMAAGNLKAARQDMDALFAMIPQGSEDFRRLLRWKKQLDDSSRSRQ
jgi:tetratricopeptide (TPR) repeat protein